MKVAIIVVEDGDTGDAVLKLVQPITGLSTLRIIYPLVLAPIIAIGDLIRLLFVVTEVTKRVMNITPVVVENITIMLGILLHL